MENILPPEIIENRIFHIRKRKVMLDSHLAELYGVTTKALNQAVKRNKDRFPADFMFQLNLREAKLLTSQNTISNLRSQIVTSSLEYGGRRYLPYAFTEQGVAMLSTVLRSKHAVQVNIVIMRTFVKLREIMATHIDLARKIEDLEAKYENQDKNIKTIFTLIKALLEEPKPEPIEPEPEKPPIGFRID